MRKNGLVTRKNGLAMKKNGLVTRNKCVGMRHKSLLLTLVLAMMCMVAAAQTNVAQMSDEQLAKYIQSEYTKGVSQQQIVIRLIESGVSKQKLDRIRRKYLSGNQALPGADGKTNISSSTRARAKQKDRLAIDKKNNEINQARQENFQNQSAPSQQSYDDVNNIGLYNEGPQDSLMYYMDQFFTQKKIFGHDIFSKDNLTFEPNMNMATPQNYALGAGDELIIDVWGASQKTYNCEVSPDGVIVIDEIGPISVAGLTVKSATQRVRAKLSQYFSDCKIALSVGNVRTIQVQVLGEVEIPGTYSLSGFSTAFNALYAAGGISEIGTLRNIKVFRQGKLLSVVDVYDYLVNGNSRSDVRLQDNDIIMVDAYDCLVNVEGKVKRPMYYEMRKGESVKQLITFTGGFTGDAYTKNVRLTRKAGAEYSIFTIGEFEMGSFGVEDDDEVYVDSVVARFSNMVEVRGAVNHPGQYQLGSTIQSVKDLLTAADGLREDAYQKRAVMHRRKADMSLQMVGVDVKGILDGTAPDMPLQKNDLLFIPSQTEMRGKQTVEIKGEVVYPGEYEYAENTTLQDIIIQAGGLTDAASFAHVNVFRRIADPQATEDNDQMAKQYSLALDENFNLAKDTTFYLRPYDEVYIRRSPGYAEQQNVIINGCVNFSGEYTLTKKDYRLSDLVKASGGFTSLAYVPGARLTRRLTEDERVQRDNALRQAQIQLYEQALKAENANMDFDKADTLLSMKMNLDDTYPVAVDLDKAIANPGGPYDIVLRENDVVTVPQFTNTVKVSGEVSYPISMNYQKGEKLKYYINHAGGFSDRARKHAVYIVYANGSVEKVDKGSSKAVQPGCEIVVPTKEQSRKLTTAETMAIGTGTASIATMIVSMINLMK